MGKKTDKEGHRGLKRGVKKERKEELTLIGEEGKNVMKVKGDDRRL